MRKLFNWTMVLAAAFQLVVLASQVHNILRDTGVYSKEESVAPLEITLGDGVLGSLTTFEVLSQLVVILVLAAITLGFFQRARVALIGIATVSFTVVLLFQEIIYYPSRLAELGIVALGATAASAWLEWRGLFYEKISKPAR